VEAIRSEQAAGRLKGFDIIVGIVESAWSKTVHLHGRVANKQTRDTLLDIARGQPGVSGVVDFTVIVGERDLPDKVALCVSDMSKLSCCCHVNWDLRHLKFKSK